MFCGASSKASSEAEDSDEEGFSISAIKSKYKKGGKRGKEKLKKKGLLTVKLPKLSY